jgi:hypothetical protein
MDTAAYIDRLHMRRLEYADRALSTAAVEQPAFEYGKHVGFTLGLRAAEALIAEMMEEEREEDK